MNTENTLHIAVDSLPSSGVSCIDILLALLTPTIGFIAIWIAYQQHKLHRDKFKLDLFEKRHAVFNETRTFLLFLFKNGIHNRDGTKLTNEHLKQFRIGTADATFLFNENIAKLITEIDDFALDLSSNHEQYEDLEDSAQKSELLKKSGEIRKSIIKHLEDLQEDFSPYLRLNNWQ